jgi:hypothetical protein
MDSDIIIRIEAEPDEINQNLRKFTNFINNKFHQIGWSIFFELFEHGVIIFYKGLVDFEHFHDLLFDLRKSPRVGDVSINNTEIQATLHFILIENKSEITDKAILDRIAQVYEYYGEKKQTKHQGKNLSLIYKNVDAFQRLFIAVLAYLDMYEDSGIILNELSLAALKPSCREQFFPRDSDTGC